MAVAGYDLDRRTHVIEVDGEVDLYSAPPLEEQTALALGQGAKHVIFDLSRVNFIDSTGLGILVGALKRLRISGGTLSLVVTDYDVERLFELTGLRDSFQIYRSRDDALERLDRTGSITR